MAISFVGASSQFAAAGSQGAPGSIDVVLPTNVENDYLLSLCFSNQAVAVAAATPSFTFSTPGWVELTDPGSSLTGNVRIRLFRKFAGAAEEDPTVTVSERAGGWSSQIAAYRGVSLSSPEHLAVADSHISVSTTHTPGARTTEDDLAWALAIVGADQAETGISTTTPQGFIDRMTGSAYATTQGGDHAVALADKEITPVGAVTMPTFTHINPTTWVGLTLALNPQIGTFIHRTVSGTLSGVLVP